MCLVIGLGDVKLGWYCLITILGNVGLGCSGSGLGNVSFALCIMIEWGMLHCVGL